MNILVSPRFQLLKFLNYPSATYSLGFMNLLIYLLPPSRRQLKVCWLALFIGLSINPGAVNNAVGASINLVLLQKAKHIIVLKPSQTLAHIRRQTTKTQVVLFSSFDKNCQSCSTANRAFYNLSLKHAAKIGFIFINTQPWGNVELETGLKYRLSNTQPVSLILYQTKILRRLVGSDYHKMADYVSEVAAIVSQKRLAFYADELRYGDFHAVVIRDKYAVFLDKYLNTRDDYKAVAVALGKRDAWTASQKVGYLSQTAANQQALMQCNQRWNSTAKKSKCKLYMVGDEYVYTKTAGQIAAITQAKTGLVTRIDKSIAQLNRMKNNKALAISLNRQGNWTSSYVYNQKSAIQAKNAVLKSCEKRRLKRNITAPCQLYFLNGDVITRR